MIHNVMNCKDWEEEKFKSGSWGSFKRDGVRAFYYPGENVLWSRDKKKLYGFDHIIRQLKGLHYPHTVDMELFIPGYTDWNKMAGAIRNHSLIANALADVIDIPSIRAPFIDRYKEAPRCDCLLLPVQTRLTTTYGADLLYDRAIADGFEGIVVKTPGHLYGNRRSYDWMRKVPFQAKECKCVGVYEGKGKMTGIAGGIYIEFNGMKCKVGTMKGLSYDDRWHILRYPDLYVGRIAEVHYKELQPSGKPRQPRFKGWRDDKKEPDV